MSDLPLSLEALRQVLTPMSCCDSCFDVAHTWTPSCLEGFWDIFSSVMITSVTKIYPPLYLIGALLRKENKEYFKTKFLRDILQSSLAISVNGSVFIGTCCLLRKVIGRFYFLSTMFLPGVVSSFLAINIERKERQGVLSLYMFNQAIEMFYNMMKNKGYIIPVPYGEVWLFSAATAIAMYLYRSGMKKGLLKSLVSFFVGPNNPMDVINSREIQRRPWQYLNQMQYDCVKHSAKAFGVGYGLQVLSALPKLLKKPGLVFKVLFNRGNLNCGLFLGSYVAIFKIVEYTLTWFRQRNDDYNVLIAGGLSGLSMMFYRSSVIALYLASKTLEVLYKRGKAQGLLPSIPYATILVYTLSTASVFHGCIFDVHHVRTSYWRYLNLITGNRFCEVNRRRLGEVFGKTDSLRLFPPENIYSSLAK